MMQNILARPFILLMLFVCLPLVSQAQERPDIQWMRGGHNNPSQGVKYTPDGETILSLSAGDVNVKLFRASDGQLLRTVPLSAINARVPVSGLAVSPDGLLFAVCVVEGSDNFIKLFQVADGALARSIPVPNKMYALAFSPNGLMIAGGASSFPSKSGVWNVSDGSLVSFLNGGNSVGGGIAFSPNNLNVAATQQTSLGTRTSLIRVSDGQPIKGFATTTAGTVQEFSPSGQYIAVTTNSGVGIIDVTCTGSCGFVFSQSGFTSTSAVFSPDGQFLAAGAKVPPQNNAHVKLWRASDWSEVNSWQAGLFEFEPVVAFSPDSQNIVSAYSDVRIWSVPGAATKGTLIRQLTSLSNASVGLLSVTSDGRTVALALSGMIRSMHEHVQLSKAEDGEPLKFASPLSGHLYVFGMAFADNDQKLIMTWSLGNSGYVRVVNTADGSLVRETQVNEGYGGPDIPMVVSPDGQTYAVSRLVGSSQIVTLYNVADGSLIRELDGSSGLAENNKVLAFSPDGQILATRHNITSYNPEGDNGPKIRLYNVADGSILRTIDSSTSRLAFSPDGEILALSGGNNDITLWRVSDATLVRTLTGHQDWVGQVAFAPDGETLASVSSDRTIRLWRVSDGTTLKIYDQETGSGGSAIAYSPDGSRIFYGRQDATIVAMKNPIPMTYAIKGRVTTSDSTGVKGVAGVPVKLTGTQTLTKLTDAEGYYSFRGLPPGGDFTVTPSKTNISFTPASKSFTNVTASISNVNFNAPSLTVNNVTVTEGNTGEATATFTVKLSAARTEPVTVKYATANGTATSPADYTSLPLTTLTFDPGQTAKQVTVKIKSDLLDEAQETFRLLLSSPTGALITDNEGVCTINDNDLPPSIKVNSLSVVEANTGANTTAAFTVTLSAPSGLPVTVKYQTSNGTALAPADYTAKALATLTFSPGQTTQTIPVQVRGDALDEINESFKLLLSGPTNATVAAGTGTCTINDNDAPPAITIANVSAAEPDTGTRALVFTVKLSAASGQTVSVKYATANGTTNPATAGTDYTAVALTTLTFLPGQTSKTVTVQARGDLLKELNETFFVNLSAPTNATIADPQGLGTILNDD